MGADKFDQYRQASWKIVIAGKRVGISKGPVDQAVILEWGYVQ